MLTELDCQSRLGTSDYLLGDRGVDIDLAPGDDVTCTFVNKKPGTITVVKDADPSG